MIDYGEPYAEQRAACDDADCGWRLDATTSARLALAAERHVEETGHSVTLFVEKRMTLSVRESVDA